MRPGLSANRLPIAAAMLLGCGVVVLIIGWVLRSAAVLAASLALGLAAVTCAYLAGRAGQPADLDAADGSGTVWVNERRLRYHNAGCRVLGSSAQPISRNEAVAAGLAPCGLCGVDG